MAEASDLACPECGRGMFLRDGKYGKFFACDRYPECRGSHGADPNGVPLGVPANSETKTARIKAHEALEKVEAVLGKGRTYKWLAIVLHIPQAECHIARFDLALCERTIGAVTTYLPDPKRPRGRRRRFQQ